jgi:hypothetical protein
VLLDVFVLDDVSLEVREGVTVLDCEGVCVGVLVLDKLWVPVWLRVWVPDAVLVGVTVPVGLMV